MSVSCVVRGTVEETSTDKPIALVNMRNLRIEDNSAKGKIIYSLRLLKNLRNLRLDLELSAFSWA